MKQLLDYFKRKPVVLLLTDAIGAFVTAFSLFVIIRNLKSYFAMPDPVLITLSMLAAAFSLYAGSRYLFLRRHPAVYLKIMMVANTVYCVLTIVLLVIYYPVLTVFDLLYFIGELLIILLLIMIEGKVVFAVKEKTV